LLRVPEVVVETERQDQGAAGETEFGCDGSAEGACGGGEVPEAPKMVARTPECRSLRE
jgi:hypothetical protein